MALDQMPTEQSSEGGFKSDGECDNAFRARLGQIGRRAAA